MSGANADDGSGDGVGRADRDPGKGSREQGDSSGGFGAESADRFELGNARTHRVDDPPSPKVGAEGNGGVGGKDDGPVKSSPCTFEFRSRDDVRTEKCASYDAHGFLRIIAPVSQ